MTPEAMEAWYQERGGESAMLERVVEEMLEQSIVDEVYSDLDAEPDTIVRGLP